MVNKCGSSLEDLESVSPTMQCLAFENSELLTVHIYRSSSSGAILGQIVLWGAEAQSLRPLNRPQS